MVDACATTGEVAARPPDLLKFLSASAGDATDAAAINIARVSAALDIRGSICVDDHRMTIILGVGQDAPRRRADL
jgi:hypothetical protein